MSPKAKISKEEILDAAVSLVRKEGVDALNARALALRLNCSTQPIFSNFSTMEQLRLAVVEQANQWCEEFIRREEERGEYPAYKASGMAYIRFAKEEKELFKLLYMRARSREAVCIGVELNEKMEGAVTQATGLRGEVGKLFHLEMWVFVHGIASMLATGFLELEEDLIAAMITDCYQGLRKRYGLEG